MPILQPVFTALLMCALVSLAHSKGRPPAPPKDMLAAPGHPGWNVDANTGCWIWNPNPVANEIVLWSGGCGDDGRATGLGTLEYRNDGKVSRYEGQIRDGTYNGHGKLSGNDGSAYNGEFVNGKANGRGVMLLAAPNGRRYEGEFRNWQLNGRGVLLYPNGTRYDGEWRDGKKNGRGVQSYTDGTRLDGEWRDDKIVSGLQTFKDGSSYFGSFNGFLPDGFGELTAADGSLVAGQWSSGCLRDGARILAAMIPEEYCKK